MATPITRNISLSGNPGTRTLPSASIPVGYTQFEMVIDRTNWTDPAVKISAQIDLSFDGGATWATPWARLTAEGGPVQPASPLPGAPNPNETTMVSDLGDPNNAARRARASFTISGGPLVADARLILT